jgi:hypothetical protein
MDNGRNEHTELGSFAITLSELKKDPQLLIDVIESACQDQAVTYDNVVLHGAVYVCMSKMGTLQ